MKLNGDNIIYVGHDLSDKGGIATLENSYSRIVSKYRHIVIYDNVNAFLQMIIFVKACVTLIYHFMCDKSIKIVHVQTASGIDFFRNAFPVFIARAFNKKVVLHVHGGYFPDFCNAYKRTTNFVLNRVDCLIAVSKYLQKSIEDLGIQKPVYCVYNIVDKASEISPKDYSQDGILSLGFLGTINANKRIFDIVNMFIKHPDLKNKYRLKIAGIGDTNRLQKLIDNNKLNNCIKYIGWIDMGQKRDFFQHIDLLIQPSDFESFGLSIAEAMSYGCPVIATRVGGIPEIIEDSITGYLIEVGDFEYLYNILSKIYDDKKQLSFISAQALSSMNRFSENKVIEDLFNIYKKLQV